MQLPNRTTLDKIINLDRLCAYLEMAMSLNKRTYFLLILFFSVFISATYAFADDKKHVLILNSYHQGFKWTDEVTKGAIESITSKRSDIRFYVEYMGTKWVFDKQYFEKLQDIYKTKFKTIRFDAIIASDNDAFDFLRKYRNETFGEIPVVFCGVNWFKSEDLSGQTFYTGVNEDADIVTNLDLMLKLHPAVKNIYMVVDLTTTGQIVYQKVKELIPRYMNRVKIHILDDLEIPQIIKTVSELSEDSLVFLTIFQKDKSGAFVEYSEIAGMLSKNSRVPVYGLWDFYLGSGIVGGMLTSGHAQGSSAGTLVLRILNGEVADLIPVTMESPNRYRFDFVQMERFGIKQSQLPSGSSVINEPPSFYEVNKGFVWGLIAGVVMLTVSIVILMINTHRRTLAEDAFHNSEKRYSTLVDNLALGIFRNDGLPGGKFLQANPAMVKMFGYESTADFLSISVDSLYQDPEERKAVLEEVTTRGFVKDKEVLMKKNDGESVWVSINSNAKFDNAGRLVWIDGLFEDITNKKHLELQLQQSQKMEAIGTLAGGVAHDFNNILTAIIGYGNLLKMKFGTNETVMNYVTPMLYASEKATQLTKSLLAFSRKQTIILKKTNINDIVDGMSKLLLRVIGDDIQLNIKIYGDKLIVEADSGQLEQVLLNLVTNARDAMPKGGLISIETSRISVGRRFMIKHDALPPGEYAAIFVSDTGTGMSETTQLRIFEPFFSTKDVGKGTGLGLSIVYGIIKQHKGDIGVYSEIGTGTTFKIYLPLVHGEEDEKVVEDDSPVVGGTEVILVADDDEQVRMLILEVLEAGGYKVLVASDGDEAIAKFKENADSIDLALLDVVMAKKNGKEVFDLIHPIRPDLKVLFMSGYTADIINQKGVLDDKIEFVSKPLSPDVLLKKVRQVLSKTV